MRKHLWQKVNKCFFHFSPASELCCTRKGVTSSARPASVRSVAIRWHSRGRHSCVLQPMTFCKVFLKILLNFLLADYSQTSLSSWRGCWLSEVQNAREVLIKNSNYILLIYFPKIIFQNVYVKFFTFSNAIVSHVHSDPDDCRIFCRTVCSKNFAPSASHASSNYVPSADGWS